MTTQIEINTLRLILKSITPSVIHELFSTKNKEDIMQYFGFDEVGYAFYKDMHEKGVETFRISMFSFLLVEKETNLPIGECGYHTWNKAHRRAEVYYHLRNDEVKQKGYMTEGTCPNVILHFLQIFCGSAACVTSVY